MALQVIIYRDSVRAAIPLGAGVNKKAACR
jgi:hypothetical protein